MADRITVEIKRLPHGHGLDLPVYATSGAAGMDVPAIDATITDNKDASSLLGLADTDADDFTWAPAPWDHWWQD